MARPREEYRFEPIDTKPDVAVGVGLPFAGRNNVFHLNYTTKDQALSNLRNLMLTRKGERVMQPEFGWIGWDLLFDNNTPELQDKIKAGTLRDLSVWLPYIILDKMRFEAVENTIKMSMDIRIEPELANTTITLELASTGGVTITEE
jgi:phage baseplate assembly protein W